MIQYTVDFRKQVLEQQMLIHLIYVKYFLYIPPSVETRLGGCSIKCEQWYYFKWWFFFVWICKSFKTSLCQFHNPGNSDQPLLSLPQHWHTKSGDSFFNPGFMEAFVVQFKLIFFLCKLAFVSLIRTWTHGPRVWPLHIRSLKASGAARGPRHLRNCLSEGMAPEKGTRNKVPFLLAYLSWSF